MRLSFVMFLATACGTPATAVPAADDAELAIRVRTRVSGVEYRLFDARFEVWTNHGALRLGPAGVHDDSLNVRVTEGEYGIVLRDGWSLVQGGHDAFRPIRAVLLPPGEIEVYLGARQTTTIGFAFETECTVVDFGEVNLNLCDGCGNPALNCN